MTARKARVPLFEPQSSTCRCMAITEPRGGEGSAVCARGGDTSRRPWLQSWPRTSTMVPHGDRGRPGQGRERETNYTATLRKMLSSTRLVPGTLRWMPGTVGEAPAAGRPVPLLEVLRRNGYSSAPRSRSSTLCLWSRCSMTLCRRW